MTANEFLLDLLRSQTIGKDSIEAKDLKERRAEVENVLLREFGGDNPRIRYAGSYIKGTMVRDSYDLDLACYFPHTKDLSLPEIRRQVEALLSDTYIITAKSSAVRIIRPKDASKELAYHIDVVPGRFVDETMGDAYLHVAYGEKARMKTNLDTHIQFVTDSGRQDVLKLNKIWKVRNGIDAKTFVMDIFHIEALKGFSSTGLDLVFKKALEEIANHIETRTIVDPANGGNIVSQAMSPSQRQAVATFARNALQDLSRSPSSIEVWQRLFKVASSGEPAPGNGNGSPYIAPAPILNPVKPFGA
jgi:hypothetical protein